MSFLSKFWGYIVAGILGLISILAYIIKAKSDQVASLQAQALLANTKEKVSKIDGEIKKLKESKELVKEDLIKLEATEETLKDKKTKIAKKQGAKNNKEIEDYWKNS